MIDEFKAFINRGNVVDLAVAVVIGAAFGSVVTSFTNDILMQVIAAVGGEPDFSALTLDMGKATLRYGAFLTSLSSFLIIAFSVFLVVKAINAAQRPSAKTESGDDDPPAPTELEVLMEIKEILASRP